MGEDGRWDGWMSGWRRDERKASTFQRMEAEPFIHWKS